MIIGGRFTDLEGWCLGPRPRHKSSSPVVPAGCHRLHHPRNHHQKDSMGFAGKCVVMRWHDAQSNPCNCPLKKDAELVDQQAASGYCKQGGYE